MDLTDKDYKTTIINTFKYLKVCQNKEKYYDDDSTNRESQQRNRNSFLKNFAIKGMKKLWTNSWIQGQSTENTDESGASCGARK